MLHIENFVAAIREGRTNDAMKSFKSHLNEQKERVKDEQVQAAATEFGMSKKVTEAEEEAEDEPEDLDESMKDLSESKKLGKEFWDKMKSVLKKMGGSSVVVNPGYIQARFEDKAKADEIKKMFTEYGLDVDMVEDPGGQGYFIRYETKGRM